MSSSYYNTILSRALTIHPALVVDEPLFQSLLLALVARQKSIIIRSAEEAKLLTLIINILHLLFGLSVVKLRIRQNDRFSPDDFLRLLFLENPVHGQHTSRRSSHRTLNAGGNLALAFRRSSSYPNQSSTDATVNNEDGVHNFLEKFGSQCGIRSSLQSAIPHERQSLLRSHTDPTPLWHEDAITEHAAANLFPNALVVSGLEYTSEEVQSALWTAMTERQLSLGRTSRMDQNNAFYEGLWQLPADFFVVYVCPLSNGFDRPPVHKSLVDRFALSIDAYPHAETILDNRMRSISPMEAETASLKPILSPLELADLRVLADPGHTIIGSRVDLYLSDLLTATRHHPHLDGMLITARCRAQALDVLRAWRALFGSPPDNNGDTAPSLDVTDEDVRKVFIKVVQHRVCVLEGPRHEILASLVFTMVGEPGDEEWEVGRRTVKEVLKEILDNV